MFITVTPGSEILDVFSFFLFFFTTSFELLLIYVFSTAIPDEDVQYL